jgi:hypothetical protein
MIALGTLHLQESRLQLAAFEVIVDFLLYASGQGPVLRGHHIPKRRLIPLDELIEKCPFWSMTLIG